MSRFWRQLMEKRDAVVESVRVRRQLIERRDAIVGSVAAQAVEAHGSATGEDMSRIERYDSLIKATAVKHGSRRHAALVGLACVTLGGLAWVWPVSDNWIQIDARVREIRLSLAEEWELDSPVGLKTVWLEDFSEGAMPARSVQRKEGVTREFLEGDDQSLTLRGGEIELQLLHFFEGAEFEISSDEYGSPVVIEVSRPRSEDAHEGHAADDRRLVMEATLGAKSGGEEDALTVIYDEDDEFTVTYDSKDAKPERLGFSFRSESGRRMFGKMQFGLEDKLALPLAKVDLLEFRQEKPENSRGDKEVECSIVEGSLRLLDTQRTLTLRDRDCLTLESVEFGRLLELTIDHEAQQASDGPIHLLFEGRARRILIGAENYQRDVTPSYLEWLYNHQRLALLWGAMAFLWGMLWSTRAMFVS